MVFGGKLRTNAHAWRAASKSRRPRGLELRLSSLVAWTAILGLSGVVAGCILAQQGGLLHLLYPSGALLVGGLLYLRHPALYVGLNWWVWFLTPEVRRLVDYQSGWHPQSTVMLAPYLVAGLAFITLLRHSPKLQVFPFLPIGLVSAGLAYGFGIGVLKVGASAATFDLLNWAVPVVMAFHLMVRWRDYPDYRRVTQRAFLWGVLVMGLYGLQQFVDPPAWDQFWMQNAPMASIGSPEPFKVRVFSTMNSPGPFAAVITAGLLVLLSSGGLRSWTAIGAGFVGFMLSLVRSVWVALVVGLCILAAHRGRSRPRLLATLVVTGLVVWPLLTFGPIAETLNSRLQTLNYIQQDTSFVDRLEFYGRFAPQAFFNVLGEGLGSTGVATKLSNGGELGRLGDFDSGIMAIPFTLGWPGTLLFMSGLVWLALHALRSPKRPDTFAAACRAVVAGSLAQFVFQNVATGVSGMVFWYFLGLAMAARAFHARSAKDIEQQRGPDGQPSEGRQRNPRAVRGQRMRGLGTTQRL